jgi:hypothetical protein
MAEELQFRQVCPDCGRVDPDSVWHGEGETLEVGYLGPATDGLVLDRRGPGRVDVQVRCPDCAGGASAG